MTENIRRTDIFSELCDTKHVDLDRRIEAMEKAVFHLQNRPPVWTTIVMTIMGTMIGALVGKVI